MVAKVKVKAYFILALLMLISISFVSAFSVEPGSDVSMCAGTTSTIIDNILDAGIYTITSSGSAAAFSTTIPSGLMSAGAAYSYISPQTTALPGIYDLKVSIKSENEIKDIDHKITVTDCHASALAVDADKTSCTCQEAIFMLTLKNSGDYLESYDILAEGTAKKFTTLSDSIVIIGAGEEKTIKAYVQAPCDVYGKYEITFKAKAQTSLSIASVKANLNIEPCYEYSIDSPETYYSMCDNAKLEVPLTVKNTGTADNTYSIKLSAPAWAVLDKNHLALKSQEDAVTNILLNPQYLTSGNFSINAELISGLGEVKKSYEITANVEKCYDVLVDIDKESDKLCNAVSNQYQVRLKNTGKYKNVYDLSVAGEFSKLSEQRVMLDADEEKAISLDVSPPYDAAAKTYAIKVTAVDAVSKASASDSIDIDVATLEQCYQPSINAKSENIEIAKDSTATDLLIIENKGTDNGTYLIDMSGTASAFSEINPAVISLAPGKAEAVYLYIAPEILTNEGDYEAVITVRMKDTTVLSSKTIKIKVSPAAEKAGEAAAEETPSNETEVQKESFFEKLGIGFAKIGSAIESAAKQIRDFFVSAFSKHEQEIPENMTVGEIKEGYISGALSEKQITEYFKSLNISDESIQLFIEKWKSEALEEANASAAEEEANASIESENATVASSENVSITIEVENETAAEAENISEVPAEEETEIPENLAEENLTQPEIIVENQTGEIAPKFNFKIDFSAYKHYIIGAVIIILILLLFITGFWKKIIEFFEEEADQPKNNRKK